MDFRKHSYTRTRYYFFYFYLFFGNIIVFGRTLLLKLIRKHQINKAHIHIDFRWCLSRIDVCFSATRFIFCKTILNARCLFVNDCFDICVCVCVYSFKSYFNTELSCCWCDVVCYWWCCCVLVYSWLVLDFYYSIHIQWHGYFCVDWHHMQLCIVDTLALATYTHLNSLAHNLVAMAIKNKK